MERWQVERLLRGDYFGAGVEPPLHGPEVWRGLNEQLQRKCNEALVRRGYTGFRHLLHPEFSALLLNVPVLDRIPTGTVDECTDGETIYFEPCADPRIEGGRIGHGLSHVLFTRWQGDHNETDAWHFTAEIFLPARFALSLKSSRAAALIQPAAPSWLLDAQFEGALARFWRAAQ